MTTFSYTIKSNSRSKGVRIAVYHDGVVIVTKPKRISNIQVRLMVERKAPWILEQIEKLGKKPKKLLAHHSIKEFAEYKQEAYVAAHNQICHFNQFYNYRVGKICIRNQKTRWGSCSGKKNLNFNYKIAFLPEHLQEYLVVHELCHLKEMNHSQKFWDLVGQQIPDYKERRKELGQY